MVTATARIKIDTKINELPAMDKAALLKVWSEILPAPPPPKLRKELMVPVLAYRIQELEFGGLSQTARRRLRELIEQNRATGGRAKASKPSTATAKLIRSWRGEIHEVAVLESGYLYRGETFKALSPIAKRITGTPWSGPLFFGVKKGSK